MSNYFFIPLKLKLLEAIVHPQKIEICGSSNSGSTALSIYIAKKFSENGFTSLFVDISKRVTRQYAIQNGPEDLAIIKASRSSEIYEIFDNFKDNTDLFIFDDLASISTGEKYKSNHKEIISNMLNYLNREGETNTLLFLNQLRIDPITTRSYSPYGYLLDANMRIHLRVLENRRKYRIIQGDVNPNDFGNEDQFSFNLYQDRLEGTVKANENDKKSQSIL